MKRLLAEYGRKKIQIKKRLKEFEDAYKRGDRHVFGELCFCVLTPQSKAVNCDSAIKALKRKNLLFSGSQNAIKHTLRKSVRFHNRKAAYLVGAREVFKRRGRIEVKRELDADDTFKTREWLVKNIKGLGYKEASHFLRNIGLGRDLAILDVHIMRNLKRMGVIEKMPHSLTRKNYVKIEDKMRSFAKKINIPLGELDLLFWSRETGFIFK